MKNVRKNIEAAARENTAEVTRLINLIREQHKQENAKKLKRDFQHGTTFNMA